MMLKVTREQVRHGCVVHNDQNASEVLGCIRRVLRKGRKEMLCGMLMQINVSITCPEAKLLWELKGLTE